MKLWVNQNGSSPATPAKEKPSPHCLRSSEMADSQDGWGLKGSNELILGAALFLFVEQGGILIATSL